MSRAAEAASYSNACNLRMLKNPLIDPRQKFTLDTEVYIRPIMEKSMLHFTDDCIAVVEGTYAQLYSPHNPTDEDLKEYSTNIASWYRECQLMPTEGRTLEECQAACLDYFGKTYKSMVTEKQKIQENCPIGKMFSKAIQEAREDMIKQLDDSIKKTLMGEE